MTEALNFDALFTLAEMAVTMIGVSGLVTIFLSRGELQPADRLRFMAILLIGFMAAILAYVPYWLSKYVEDPTLVWRYSSMVATAVICSAVLTTVFTRGMSGIQQLQTLYPLPLQLLTGSLPWLIISLFLMNALSWPFLTGSTPYELALMLMIGAITVHFGCLVIYRAPAAS